MKKIFKCIFLFLIMIPVLVNASNFSSAKTIANGYQNKFLNHDRYLKASTNKWGLDANGRLTSVSGFSTGGLITKTEIEITRKSTSNPMSFSYIYDGTKIWTIDGKIVSDSFIDGSDAKTKVTEYVKHDVSVTGTGTYDNPWIFVDTYQVTVTARDYGKIQVGSDEPAVSKTQKTTSNKPITFNIIPNAGYRYANHTCGKDAHVENNVLTFDTVEKDISCEIIFSEARDAVTLTTPCFNVPTTLYGTRNHCFSNPAPNQFYYRYGLGYYNDSNLTVRVGQLTTRPARTGWTFDGYYVGDTEFISASGVYETTYKVIDEAHKDIQARGHANEYTITYNKQGGKINVGADTAKVLYDHDLPSIILPRREGYIFQGYFTGTNGSGKRYYNADGTEADTWSEAANTTLYAKWKLCSQNFYCPGDNVEHPCPIGYGTENNGSTSCTQCRYWDSCLTGGVECRWGCGQCCEEVPVNHAAAGYSFSPNPPVYRTLCSDCNCSSCYYVVNTCAGGWVYLQANNNSCTFVESEEYVVTLDKQGGTGGTSSYKVSYYGTKAVTSVNNNADEVYLEVPTKAGYVFDGYYTGTNGSGTKIIGTDIIYKSTYDKNKTDYTHNELNDQIDRIRGVIVYKGIKSIVNPSANSTFTIYANWLECEVGNYCRGDNKSYYCSIGTFQNQRGQTSCIDCTTGSVQDSIKETYCNACGEGYTNTGTANNKCDTKCTNNNGHVTAWKTPSWNTNNTVKDVCTIQSCASGYVLTNNTCVDSTPPTCTLTASASGVTFASKTDNIGVTAYGMNKSGSAEYNSTGTLSLSAGTFYGYVKDAAGNTGSCSLSVEATKVTKYNKTTKTCTKYVSGYNKTTKTCGITSYTYSWSNTSTNGLTSCATTGSFGCDKDHVGQSRTDCNIENENPRTYTRITHKCTKSPNYSFTSSTSSASTCSTGSSFTCNSGNSGKSYVSKCDKAYDYKFEDSTSSVDSCSTGSSFTCNSSNNTKSYVSKCAATAYECKTSGYTKINDSWCYK